VLRLTSKGNYEKTRNWLKKQSGREVYANLDKYGQAGVSALARATPVDTGLTRDSWRYRIIKDRRRPGIEWYNTNTKNGVSVAILIQYGHGTGRGGYIQGRDYINPAMRPVFDQIVAGFWKEVTSWQR
jgi:hypothetical protein